MLEAEMRFRRITRHLPPPEPPLGPCPKCGAICRVRVGGAGIVCNACGFQDRRGEPEPEPQLNRSDIGRIRIVQRRF